MQELLIVGRGGEGVVLASQLLADTLARVGFAVQAFPEFTAERRGAPISAFVRWDDSHPIRRRYKIGDCDVLLGVSQSLPGADVLQRVRPGGLVLVNHDQRISLTGAFRLARVPASRIARERGITSSEGRPLGNTALLGAAVHLLAPEALDKLEQAITARMGRLAADNVAAARDGYSRCTHQRRRADDLVVDRVDRVERAAPTRPPFPISTVDSRIRLTGRVVVRQAAPDGCVHRVRALRRVLSGRRPDAPRRRDGRGLRPLQGLWDLRERLPGPRRTRHGGDRRVSVAVPTGRVVQTANEVAALAVVLARARAIGCYPITPQTLIVERLAELVAGREDIEYATLESEHAMFGYVIAAARAGVRTFTATSSQGLLYAHEQLHRASRERVPLVAVDVNRAVFAPWSIEPDLTDSLAQRDTGWIQLYCSSAQEVLDSILCAYRIAEAAMLPVLVCLEGFLLSHTAEVVDVPAQSDVDAFLPPFQPPDGWLLDPRRPRVYSALPPSADYYAFQRNVAAALDDARNLVADVAAEFSAVFGREKVAALELAGNRDATTALVTLGTVAETAHELLAEDDDLLIVRVHTYRPFPSVELADALAGVRNVVVFDRAAAFGSFGPLGADVRALRLPDAHEVVDVVGGLGGADVTPSTLRWAIEQARSGARHAAAPIYVPEGA